MALYPVGRKLAILALLLWAGQNAQARAEQVEQRDFTVLVDGKEVGQTRYTITQKEDGATLVTTSANVRVKILITYTYNLETSEYWKDGKLLSLKASCNDNGKRTEVEGVAQANHFRVVANGLERQVPLDVWSTCYWKLADARYHNKAVPLLDSDTGKEYTGQLHYVGTEQVLVGNQAENCFHFRVTGGPDNIDLWFDRHHRLVRQDFVASGHRTILQLQSIRR